MEYLLAAGSIPTLMVALVLGAVIGSFLNVVITRLPIQLERQWQRECAEMNGTPVTKQDRFSIAFPGSHCPDNRLVFRLHSASAGICYGLFVINLPVRH